MTGLVFGCSAGSLCNDAAEACIQHGHVTASSIACASSAAYASAALPDRSDELPLLS